MQRIINEIIQGISPFNIIIKATPSLVDKDIETYNRVLDEFLGGVRFYVQHNNVRLVFFSNDLKLIPQRNLVNQRSFVKKTNNKLITSLRKYEKLKWKLFSNNF